MRAASPEPGYGAVPEPASPIATLSYGTASTFQTLACYRLANGKIALDVIFDPDLMPVLGPLLQSPTGGRS